MVNFVEGFYVNVWEKRVLSFGTSELLLILCLSVLWTFKRNSSNSTHLIYFLKILGNVSEEAVHLILILLMWRIQWAPKSLPIYIQQGATLHSLFISGNCSTCFWWYFYPSSGAHTTLSTASGIFHTVTAICRSRGRVGTCLSVLWVAYATHSTLKLVPTLQR